jgi:hypothetical protein
MGANPITEHLILDPVWFRKRRLEDPACPEGTWMNAISGNEKIQF